MCTNTESLTLHKLTALLTAQLFSDPIESHHLPKVLLHFYQVESKQFLAELKLDCLQLKFLFVPLSLIVCLFPVPVQTLSVSTSSIVLPTLPSSTENMSRTYNQPCNL